MKLACSKLWGAFVTACVTTGAVALAPDQAFHQYVKDTWSIEEGLPQISAMAVVQGPDRYIWAATQAGIARFDGVRFTTFSPDNVAELPGMFTHDLYVDSQQRIWIGTYKGAAYFDGERFFHVPDQQQRQFDILQLAEDDNGWVMAATPRGLLRTRGESLKHLEGDPTSPLHSVFHHDGQTLAGGRGVIFRHDGSGWERIELDGLQGVPVTRFARYAGTYWAGTGQGLLRLGDDGWQPHFDDPYLANRVIETMYLDRDGNFWIGAAGALIRMRDEQVVEIVPDDSPIAHGSVMSITEDHEGSLWLGGRWDGLARLWNSWVLRHDRVEGLHNSVVWSLAPDRQGDIWVGTMDGLALFRDGRFEQLTTGAQLPHPHAYTLLPEEERVWIGTRSGLVWWQRETRQLTEPADFQPLAGIQVNGIVKRSDGDYWLATADGVWRWDGDDLHPVPFDGMDTSLMARVLLETESGDLMVGSVNGLFRHSPGGQLSRVTGVQDTYDVTAITQLADGRLIAGTLGERLLIEDQGQWHDFGTEHGLPVNSAFAITEHLGMLLVAGIRGIYELPVEAMDAYLSGQASTLPGRMIVHERGDVSGAQKGYCCNGAGNAKGFLREDGFWLPTRGGLVQLAPERIERNQQRPDVVVERVRIEGQWRNLASDESLQLSSIQRDLAFGFTVLSFQDPTSVQLQYRLVGYSDEWQAVEDPGQRVAFYTNLPAGDFVFEVRGSNNANVWSTESAVLQLQIEPRLQETPLFWILIAIALLALGWLILTLKLRSLKAQREELEQTVAERTRELSNANDELIEYSRRLKEASMTDQLTGLWNRRYLISQLPADLAHFRRELLRPGNEDQVLLFGLLDIDYFKRVNDLHGHAAGDDVLKQLAELLLKQVRQGDYVVRWGGEEFLLVFRPMPSSQPVNVAERIRAAVEQAHFEIGEDEPLRISCSFGMALYPVFDDQPGAVGWEDVGALADQALYHVKNNGRNGWCLIRPAADTDPVRFRRQSAQGLGRMLETGCVQIETGFGKPRKDAT